MTKATIKNKPLQDDVLHSNVPPIAPGHVITPIDGMALLAYSQSLREIDTFLYQPHGEYKSDFNEALSNASATTRGILSVKSIQNTFTGRDEVAILTKERGIIRFLTTDDASKKSSKYQSAVGEISGYNATDIISGLHLSGNELTDAENNQYILLFNNPSKGGYNLKWTILAWNTVSGKVEAEYSLENSYPGTLVAAEWVTSLRTRKLILVTAPYPRYEGRPQPALIAQAIDQEVFLKNFPNGGCEIAEKDISTLQLRTPVIGFPRKISQRGENLSVSTSFASTVAHLRDKSPSEQLVIAYPTDESSAEKLSAVCYLQILEWDEKENKLVLCAEKKMTETAIPYLYQFSEHGKLKNVENQFHLSLTAANIYPAKKAADQIYFSRDHHTNGSSAAKISMLELKDKSIVELDSSVIFAKGPREGGFVGCRTEINAQLDTSGHPMLNYCTIYVRNPEDHSKFDIMSGNVGMEWNSCNFARVADGKYQYVNGNIIQSVDIDDRFDIDDDDSSAEIDYTVPCVAVWPDLTGESMIVGSPVFQQHSDYKQILGIYQTPPYEAEISETIPPSLTFGTSSSDHNSFTVSTNTHISVGFSESASEHEFGTKAQEHFDANFGVNFSYSQSSSSTKTIHFTDTVQKQDIIYTLKKDFNLWIYPVFYRDKDGLHQHGYIKLIDPTTAETIPTYVSADAPDALYQPDYEVGKIISYLHASKPGYEEDNLMFQLLSITTNSDSGANLHYDEQNSVDKHVNTGVNVGINQSVSGGVEGFGVSIDVGETTHFNFSADTMFSSSHTESLSLDIHTGGVSDPGYEYQITPYFYYHKDSKVIYTKYAVQLIGKLWNSYFASKLQKLSVMRNTPLTKNLILREFTRSIYFNENSDGTVDILVNIMNNSFDQLKDIKCEVYLGRNTPKVSDNKLVLNADAKLLGTLTIDELEGTVTSTVKLEKQKLFPKDEPSIITLKMTNDGLDSSLVIAWGVYPFEAFSQLIVKGNLMQE